MSLDQKHWKTTPSLHCLGKENSSGERKDCWTTGSKVREKEDGGGKTKSGTCEWQNCQYQTESGAEANKGETIWSKSKKWGNPTEKTKTTWEEYLGQSSFYTAQKIERWD